VIASTVQIEELSAEHLALVATWLNEPATNQWLSSDWRNRDVTSALVAQVLRNRKNRLFLVRAGSVPCGLVALADLDLADKTAMVWYALGDKALSGQGVTTQALRALADLAFRTFGIASLYAWAMAENKGSQKVLLKSGFREAGRLRSSASLGGSQTDRIYFDLLPGELKRQ